MFVPLLVVYVGIAAIIAVTHKTVRIAYEEFQSMKMAGVKHLMAMETVILEDVEDNKLSGDRSQESWGYFEVRVAARIAAGALWPLGFARILVRFVFTDHHAPRG